MRKVFDALWAQSPEQGSVQAQDGLYSDGRMEMWRLSGVDLHCRRGRCFQMSQSHRRPPPREGTEQKEFALSAACPAATAGAGSGVKCSLAGMITPATFSPRLTW